MRRKIIFLLIIFLLHIVGFLLYYFSSYKKLVQNTIIIYSGMSMKTPLEKIVRSFRKKYENYHVNVIYGDSAGFLQNQDEYQKVDLYLCHYPFMNAAVEEGLIKEWKGLARMKVVIAVPKGNPQNIRKLEDLTKPGMKIGIGDPDTSGSGIVADYILQNNKFGSRILDNVTMMSKGNQKRASGVVIGEIDATIIWSSVAYAFKNKLDTISILEDQYDGITSATVGIDQLKNIDIKVGLLKKKKINKNSLIFYKYMKREGSRIFLEMGFH